MNQIEKDFIVASRAFSACVQDVAEIKAMLKAAKKRQNAAMDRFSAAVAAGTAAGYAPGELKAVRAMADAEGLAL